MFCDGFTNDQLGICQRLSQPGYEFHQAHSCVPGYACFNNLCMKLFILPAEAVVNGFEDAFFCMINSALQMGKDAYICSPALKSAKTSLTPCNLNSDCRVDFEMDNYFH
jgi:hypothetical protein